MKINKAIAVGLLGTMVLSGCGNKKTSEDIIQREYKAEEVSGIDTSSEEYKTINKLLNKAYSDNAYAKVWTSNEDAVYMHLNKEGEGYISDGRICLADHRNLTVNTDDNKVYETYDGTYLNELECALIVGSSVGGGTAETTTEEVTKVIKDKQSEKATEKEIESTTKATEQGTEVTTASTANGEIPSKTGIYTRTTGGYAIYIVGKSDIMKFYRLLSKSDEVAEMGYEVLCQGVNDTGSLYLEYDLITSEAQSLSALCRFGDKDTGYNVWLMDGYIPTNDWELPKRVYGSYLKTGEEFNEVVSQIEREQTKNLLLSNNGLEVYKDSPTYGEYIESNKKNELLSKAIASIKQSGLTLGTDEKEMKQQLKDKYTEEYAGVPLVKMLAYFVDNSDLPLEAESTTGAGK